jgi:hypothetical protein
VHAHRYDTPLSETRLSFGDSCQHNASVCMEVFVKDTWLRSAANVCAMRCCHHQGFVCEAFDRGPQLGDGSYQCMLFSDHIVSLPNARLVEATDHVHWRKIRNSCERFELNSTTNLHQPHCVDKFSGVLCAVCVDKYAIYNDKCISCASLVKDMKDGFIGLVVVAVILTVLGICVSWTLKLRVAGMVLPRLFRASGVQTMASIKILLTTVQIFHLVRHHAQSRLRCLRFSGMTVANGGFSARVCAVFSDLPLWPLPV